MFKLRFLAGFAVLFLAACEQTSTGPTVVPPTESTKPEADVEESAEPTSNPVSSRYEWEILSRRDVYRVRITNNGESVHAGLACYAGPPTDFDAQELHDYQVVSLGAGSTAELSAAIPCGQWQCDVFEGRAPEEPPYYGSRLILGRVGVQECSSPEPEPPESPEPPDGTDDPFPVPEPPQPPPEPPPVCGPDDSIDDTDGCLWNEDTCAWECSAPEGPPGVDPPNGCEPPEEHSLKLDRAIGNPGKECAFFGDYEPSEHGALFWITKCGTFYEVTESTWTDETCSNGQDVSHRTACECKDELS